MPERNQGGMRTANISVRTTAKAVKDDESLQRMALLSDATHLLEYVIEQFASDGVVASCVVRRRILLARDDSIRMEELPVDTGAHFVEYGRFEIDVERTRRVFMTDVFEESRHGRIRCGERTGAVRSDAVLETEQFPARMAYLTAGLADVKADDLLHVPVVGWINIEKFIRKLENRCQ